ncbi:POK25 protein, partial [Sula dactylatra]|nr:POK25 protein [Sula dactylatra]
MIEQAQLSHSFFHQSAKALCKKFQLSWSIAKTIVQTCPECQQFAPLQQVGVSPR